MTISERIIETVLHIWHTLTGYYDRPVPFVLVEVDEDEA